MKNISLIGSLIIALLLQQAAASSPGTVLSQSHACSDSIVIRSQNLTSEQLRDACKKLTIQESRFHKLFGTKDKPVNHDNNQFLRVNVYASRDDYVKHATVHFNMPTDNGGMYLEGLPHIKGNQAEFITYQKGEVIWNLQHEYVHYLDGRFNIYGDFCASLHDSHSPPENCAKPAPLLPHTVWWSEGVAEFIAHGAEHSRAFESVKKSEDQFALSQLFDTSYEQNGGADRVYSWGYFSVRYMMEKQRDKVDTMLGFLRAGDFPRYQALVRSWGNSMDSDFKEWLEKRLGES